MSMIGRALLHHRKVEQKVQIVGDDLFVTNPKRLKDGIEKKAVIQYSSN